MSSNWGPPSALNLHAQKPAPRRARDTPIVNILALYEKLEKLVQHLPESLQSPILREISPLKSLFLHQRPPRVLLLGDRAASRSEVVNQLFRASVAHASEDHLQVGAWQQFSTAQGRLAVLDGRLPASALSLRRVLAEEPPDVCLFLHSAPRRDEEVGADLEQASQILKSLEASPQPAKPSVFALAMGTAGEAAEDSRRYLDRALHVRERFSYPDRVRGLFIPGESALLAAAFARELPPEARLEMVRLAGLKEQQLEMARSVVNSVAAICGAVGAQPIPLADFPILTALQAAMVSGIMHISGRELSMRLAGEWIGAVGANIGLGLVMREGARAVLKFVPIWGDFVSGGIAAAGTYAVGRAATAYFIEGVTMGKARNIFRERKGPPPQLHGQE
jgi:uncharacterized protein (DUF697 family)